MANQYEVLGKAPTPEDLKKLSPNEVHLNIKNLNASLHKVVKTRSIQNSKRKNSSSIIVSLVGYTLSLIHI